MIKIQLPTRLVAIGFSHPVQNEALAPQKGSLIAEVIKVRYSHCFIVELVDPKDESKYKFISEGVARCSPKDLFEKEKGRRVALTDALLEVKLLNGSKGKRTLLKAKTDLNKEERKLIWDGYFNRGTLPSVPFSKLKDAGEVEGAEEVNGNVL